MAHALLNLKLILSLRWLRAK